MTQGKDAEKQLAGFMAKFSTEITALGEAIRVEMRKLYPTAIELVYDNYNALVIGFCPTERPSEAIFSIVLYPKWVSLFFLQARRLHDPERILQGSGRVARHIVLASPDFLHYPAVQALMREAVETAKVDFDPKGAHRVIIRAVSAKQRPRRPANKSAARASSPGIESKRKKAPVSARQR